MMLQQQHHHHLQNQQLQRRPGQQLLRPGQRCRTVVCSAAAKVPTKDLRRVAEEAAAAGAEVIKGALAKGRAKYTNKSGAIGDVVTATDKASEAAVIAAIRAAFPEHSILGEEGGMIGDGASDYLWIVDPLDGTCNFAHLYPGFCVSVGVLRHALPVAGCVIEFVGGPSAWSTKTYSGGRNLGATLDGAPLCVSESVKKLEDALVVTEFVYYDELWHAQQALLRDFSASAMGVRAGGAAATNLCHLAAGVVDAYYQFMLKPWDTAAGVVILEEAGGRVTTTDGNAYSVFDRSLLATNDALYGAMLAKTEGPTQAAIRNGAHLGPAGVPANYKVRAGAQLV